MKINILTILTLLTGVNNVNWCTHTSFEKKITAIERKGRDVWPNMVTHTRNLCSAFNPSKCTHTAVSSEQVVNTPWTHTRSSCARGAVRCLAQGSHLSRGMSRVERALDIHSPHLQSLMDLRLEPVTFGLTIRPRLPLEVIHINCVYV